MPRRNREILPFTGMVPSVARAMPRVAAAGPAALFAVNIPLVSGVIPLVSAVPPVSAPRYFGVVPVRTAEDIPRRRDIPPSEMGLTKALLGLVGAPLVLPVKIVQKIAEEVKAQAEVELDQRSRIQGEVLENAMRYEAGQITEEEYRAREADLRARLDQLRE